MKILTKEWAKKHEQLRFIHCLKDFSVENLSYSAVKKKSKFDFYKDMETDEELFKAVFKNKIFNKLYNAKIERNKRAIYSLPKNIVSQIKNIKTLILGYACEEDIKLLTDYANKTLIEVESKVKKANKISEIAEEYLNSKFILDNLIGELVYEGYENGKNYILNIGNYKICIENYEIIERENFKINKWEDDNPLTLWTAVHSAELHYISTNCYELHLLLVDGDKYANGKFWYFTLRGINIKIL